MKKLLLYLVILSTLTLNAVQLLAQAPPATAPDDCSQVRFLMEREITPYDLGTAGGSIRPGAPVSRQFATGNYSHYSVMNVILPVDANNIKQPSPLELSFSQVTETLNLEFAVYRGMEIISEGFMPLESGTRYETTLTEDGLYTLVVRRQHLTDDPPIGTYTTIAAFTGNSSPVLPNLRDDTLRAPLSIPPQLINGQETITLPSANVRVHAGSAFSVGSQGGQAAQVFFPGGFGILVGGWADEIALLGGDLAAVGDANGNPRIFFLQEFAYEADLLNETLGNLEDAAGTRIVTNWADIRGIWLMRGCAGMKLQDGRTFVMPVEPDFRQVTFNGGLDDFAIRVTAPGSTAEAPLRHAVNMNWHGITAGSETQIVDGTFIAQTRDSREIRLESRLINFFWQGEADTYTPQTPVDIALPERGATLTLDMDNLRGFTLSGDILTLDFEDLRGTVQRETDDLLRFESLESVILIVEKADTDGDGVAAEAGERRLWLPESESFIELLTPDSLPTVNGLAQPGETGYSPRALNNLGGECYPVNTMLPEANCPPNGQPNPANGNLWYSVTDLIAEGSLIDLALTRSYNSAATERNGPFGPGWTSAFLLDYDAAYDPERASRLVERLSLNYFVGLDLTWAPRGYVTFNTPTGSQHVFVSQGNEFDGGTLRALTMPGWTLSRDDLRDPTWELRQTDGLTYIFDRAGRLMSYGYPESSRVITIDYPRSTLNGPGEAGIAVISDDFALRQLELHYDENHRIVRSVLRDTTHSDAGEACTPDLDCSTISYAYNTSGHLTEVIYADGEVATYRYDDEGRMTFHDDPCAPLSAQMNYTYGENGIETVTVRDRAESVPLFTLRYLGFNTNRNGEPPPTLRRTTVTDRNGAERTFTYNIVADTPRRQTGNTYTLASISSPLTGDESLDSLPTGFTWTNGLLTQINLRRIEGQGARNSTQFAYNAAGQITEISGGYLTVTVSYDELNRPVLVQFADDTRINYVYDDDGRLVRFIDRDGLIQDLVWNAAGQVVSRVLGSADNPDWSRSYAYTYDSIGNVTSVDRDSHITTYTWDGLGRLTGVNDPLLGSYTLMYSTALSENDETYRTILITDEAGAQYTARFNIRGQLIETRLIDLDGQILRLHDNRYDAFDRILAQSVWIGEDEDPLVTRYDYATVEALAPRANEITVSPVIRGYDITITDPIGRTETYTYDALDRVRQIENVFNQVTRFDYLVTDTREQNGLRVVQRDILSGQLIRTTTYQFDLRWQLREVNQVSAGDADDQAPLSWIFSTEGDPVKPRFLIAPEADIRDLEWESYQDGRPASISLNPVPLPLVSGQLQPQPRVETAYDVLGRPLLYENGSGTINRIRYCPQPDGTRDVLISVPGAEESFNCRSAAANQRLSYDAVDRLIRVEDRFGVRTYAYSRDLTTGEWVTVVTFDADFSWELRYNVAGDLTLWRDETGTLHRYTHDGAGRLRRVEVPDEPEASLTFEYNAEGMLARRVDDLGRGTVYQYDGRGLLEVRQDALTADATTYAYDPFGQMTSAISPLGNTTSFRYEDPGDPTRLTDFIDPTGVNESFNWDDVNNALEYIARDSVTRYRFDSLGNLWRIDDAAARSYELRYDAAGKLRNWATGQLATGAAARDITLSGPDGGTVTVGETQQPDWTWNFEHNPAGYLTSITPPIGRSLDLSYDAMGQLNLATADEHSWTFTREPGSQSLSINESLLQFDSLYRLRFQSYGDGTATGYVYEPGRRGNINLTITHDGSRSYTFSPGDDSAEPRTVTLQAPGQTITYVYTPENLIEEIIQEACLSEDLSACESGEADLWTTSNRFDYDARGRPIRIIDEEQNIEIFAYDDAGNLSSYQSLNGRTFTYSYDNLNRLSGIVGPTGIKLLLAYGPLDQVTGICRTRAEAPDDYAICVQTVGQAFVADEDAQALIAAFGALESYSYDSLGNLTAQRFPTMTDTEAGTRDIAVIEQAYSNGLLSTWGLVQEVPPPDEEGEPVEPPVDRTNTLFYSLDAFTLLRQLNVILPNGEDSAHTFSYDEALRLSSTTGQGGMSYTRSADGTLTGITAEEREFDISYLPERLGYTVTDSLSEFGVGFTLNNRGFLSTLDYIGDNGESDASLLQLDYVVNPRDAGALGTLMSSADGVNTLDLQVDRRNITNNVVMNFGDLRLLIDYLTTPAGIETRQRLDGTPEELFIADAGGYITVTGYDDNDRISTIRINAKSDGTLLYTLSFTYNGNGQRETETRRFSDGTQMNIQYEYDALNQLTRQVIGIVRAEQTVTAFNGAALLLLPLLLLSWLRSKRRLAGLALLLLVGFSFGYLTLFEGQAQRRQETFTYIYSYDAAGNLSEIFVNDEVVPTDSRVCSTFTYDSAHRLIDFNQNGRQYRFAYDAHNRLVTANNWDLIYTGEAPLMAFNRANLTVYYGRVDARPPLFVGEAGQVNWLIPNGRDRLLGLASGDVEPLVLFDPLGRAISFNPPVIRDEIDLCDLIPNEASLFSLAQPESGFENMVWHPQSNLYFSSGGRAYMPEIGRYLQRDPQGPDVFGSVYDFSRRSPVPAFRRDIPPYAAGLRALQSAMNITQVAESLDAETVKRRFYPQVRDMDLWTDALVDPSLTETQLNELLLLPSWLQTAYNLPGPQVDLMDGVLSLRQDQAPGQGGLGMLPGSIALPGTRWIPNAPDSMIGLTQGLIDTNHIPRAVALSYTSLGWVKQRATLSDAWDVDAPRLDISDTPAAVLDRLPRPLMMPDATNAILDVLEGLNGLPQMTGIDWLSMLFDQALPTLPELPPRDAEIWRQRWFDDDTFGIGRALESRLDVPEPPTIPVYDIGPQVDWVHPEITDFIIRPESP